MITRRKHLTLRRCGKIVGAMSGSQLLGLDRLMRRARRGDGMARRRIAGVLHALDLITE